MKKISLICVGLLTIALGISIVYASNNSFSFKNVGDTDIGVEEKVTSFPSVVVNHHQTSADAQVGISVQSKKFLVGWGIDARSNVWIKGKTRTVVGFSSLSSKTYRPVLVFNATNDGKAISGDYDLTQGIN